MRKLLAPILGLVACNEYDVAQRTTEDRFFQGGRDTVSDVLFVVDDSASMSEEQAALSLAISAFVNAAGETTADWRLGVVSTSVNGDDGGNLVAPYVTGAQANAGQVVADSLLVGVEGDRDERGLQAALFALDGRNGDFRRTDARLEIVFVSDEDDHSAGDVSDYMMPLETLAGAGELRIHGVVGDLPAGCASPSGAADAGGRYVHAIALQEGWSESICASDFTEFMARVGLDTAAMYDTFMLSRLPNTDTLEVTVEGTIVEGAEVDGWVYDPGPNAIVFDGSALPGADAEIVVTYVARADQSATIE